VSFASVRSVNSRLVIGAQVNAREPAELLPAKFNRHTFWCGQSGSGKTYALGVVLEQLIAATRLPVVILDPNSDFVRFHEARADTATEVANLWAQRSVRVLGPTGHEPLTVRFIDLPMRSRAAIMQLDPVSEPESFNAALRVSKQLQEYAPVREQFDEWLRRDDDPDRRRFAMRLENLGTAEWDLWAWGDRDACDVIDEEHDATVLDLGAFREPGELKAAALAVLDHLWEQRDKRRPRLIVIDEAHNLCSPEPSTPVDRLLTERIVQIAAEGRKFGLWLVLSTQRPSKIHPNALSQCDNVAIMRMNAPNDLAALAEAFGFIPSELLAQATDFGQGQAIFAGGFSPQPQRVQMGARITVEGGSDVDVPMRD
jgi:DNA helicase HerA-like ATPase